MVGTLLVSLAPHSIGNMDTPRSLAPTIGYFSSYSFQIPSGKLT